MVRLRNVAGALVPVNLAVWLMFEWIRPRLLSYDALWNARTGVWAALLLFDNLVVVWLYVRFTADLVSASHQQYEVTKEELQLARKEAQAVAADRLQANKPIVVTIREEDKVGGYRYYIHNVGRGTAINVWYADLHDDVWRIQSQAALGAGEQRLLLGEVEGRLRNNPGEFKHLIVAEGIPTRTTRWTVSINVRSKVGGGSVHHLLAALQNPREGQSVDALLTAEGSVLRRQLGEAGFPPD